MFLAETKQLLHIWTAAAGKTPQGGPTCSLEPRGAPEAPEGNTSRGSGFVYPLSELSA